MERARAGGIAGLLPLALLLIATIALHARALATPFFADDFLFLDQARHHSLIATLTAPDPLGNFFRPVSRQLYFWLIAHATAESPRAFHAANLLAFLFLLAMLFAVARRLAGPRAAAIAAAIVALGYAADVPLMWASGSQDLLAVAGALTALWLYLSGRRALAGVALLLAAFSKETVLLTPLVAVIASRAPREPWRTSVARAWPLAAAVAAWALLWLAMPGHHRQGHADVHLELWGPIATLVHLAQVVLGAEWPAHGFTRLPHVVPALIPIALAIAAIVLARPVPRERAEPNRARRAMAIGLVWALAGAAPVAAVAWIWSAYYYLFASCGVALALGAWLARTPRWAAPAVVAALALGSASARSIDEFAAARSAWTPQSHIDRYYIERAVAQSDRYLHALLRARPRVPPGSTLFFTGLAGSVAFQSADGPLVRWAYRDPTLHSFYLTDFSRARVGAAPWFVFEASGDTLIEMSRGDDFYPRVGFTLLLSDRAVGADDALALEYARAPRSPEGTYWRAWTRWGLGDSLGARAALKLAGVAADTGGAVDLARALAAVAAGDTARASAIAIASVQSHGLEALHALVADLRLSRDPEDANGAVEAFAARVLAPDQPFAWRRWAMVQAHHARYLESLGSFQTYFHLLGADSDRDAEAHRWVGEIEGMLVGGRQTAGVPEH